MVFMYNVRAKRGKEACDQSIKYSALVLARATPDVAPIFAA
jgi:hypothetical protein